MSVNLSSCLIVYVVGGGLIVEFVKFESMLVEFVGNMYVEPDVSLVHCIVIFTVKFTMFL